MDDRHSIRISPSKRRQVSANDVVCQIFLNQVPPPPQQTVAGFMFLTIFDPIYLIYSGE
jgi:hypothetical protein